MKIFTVFSGPNEIEVHNTISGEEKVFYNGELMSSKRSFAGTLHRFEVLEDEEWVEYEVLFRTQFTISRFGVGVDVYRNREPLVLSH